MLEWYYILGIVSYGIFIVQFILSNFFGWTDLNFDIDCDGDADFGLSDILSFKGLIHFAMGFSSWLMLTNKITISSIAIASLIGIIFIIILYWAYKLCLRFNSEPSIPSGEQLIGKEVIISTPLNEIEYCANCKTNFGYIEIRCKLEKPSNHIIKCGEIFHISSYKQGIYFIN